MDVKMVDISEIREYENNPRKNDNAVDKVAASISDFGFMQPIVVDKDGVIIAGHTRYKAACQLGLTQVPVLFAVDLTEAQVAAYRLADNKVAEFSEWDEELLLPERASLVELDFDMEPYGFTEWQVEATQDDFDVGEALDEIEEPVSKRGDIYQLGKHKLMCGDATSEEDVKALMNDDTAEMIWTDPP